MSIHVDLTLQQGEFNLNAAFELASGQTLAIIGPNGSGKSTLLSAIAGHHSISTGFITIEGTTVDQPAKRIWVPPEDRPLALVPQDGLLFPHMTVRSNILFGLRHHKAGDLSAQEQAKRCDAALSAVDMAGYDSRYPNELSGGQAQRVAVARALALHQALLLLDEPLSRIDVSNRRKIRQVLAAASPDTQPNGPQTQILVTHGPDHAVTADLILALESGNVTGFGTPAELGANPPTAWIHELLSHQD